MGEVFRTIYWLMGSPVLRSPIVIQSGFIWRIQRWWRAWHRCDNCGKLYNDITHSDNVIDEGYTCSSACNVAVRGGTWV